MIYKLIFQELCADPSNGIRLDYDEEYVTRICGIYTSIDNVQNAIPKIYNKRDSLSNTVISIFVRCIETDTLYNDEYSNYMFFDKYGNILSTFKDDEIRAKINKYNIGDVVLLIPDRSDESVNEIEIGIITGIPCEIQNEYTMLLGINLHNHCHPCEEFLHDCAIRNDHMIDTLTKRMRIGI